jgi:SH3 domain protein
VNAIRLLLPLLVSAAALAQTETAYVTDILRLGIFHSPDASGRPFKTLVSGTELTILERVPNFAHVRTADGQDGWVKSAFLVTDKPAQLRVAEMESELDSLRAELGDLKEAKRHAEGESARLSKQMADRTDSAEAIQSTLGSLKRENEDYEARLERYRYSVPLSWVAAAIGLALVAGFVAGLWWLDASIRRRHGGFRVY